LGRRPQRAFPDESPLRTSREVVLRSALRVFTAEKEKEVEAAKLVVFHLWRSKSHFTNHQETERKRGKE